MHDGNLINHVASPPATPPKANMAESEPKYPSRTKEAFRLKKQKQRRQEAELLQRVNERLAAHNIDWKQLIRLVASGEVEIVIKEKAECRMSDNNTNRTDTVCNVGGKLYYYDACGDQLGEVKDGFVYMGSGTIHSVKGAPYKSERVFHFWRHNDRTLIEAR